MGGSKVSNLIPIEFKNQRIMTTKVLAEEYGTEEKNIQMNFLNNQKRFTEGKHYYKLEGETLKEFKNSLPNDIREPFKFASQLILWTDRGAARHAKILDTDEAWEVYEALEETYFRVKDESIDTSQLSAETQLLLKLSQSIANNELEQKMMKQEIAFAKEQTAAVKEEVQGIRELVEIRPSENWRNETNKLVKKICYKLSDYQKPKDDIYKALQERAACDLKIRLSNMRKNLALEGASKTKIDNANYLDVIANDKRLIEIYTAIVKEMAIKYKVA